jgi:hypothetical protein
MNPKPRQGPAPGDIFRDYRYTAEIIIELDPVTQSLHPKVAKRRSVSHRQRTLDIWDLEDATRAEIALEYWGGHVGTSDHKLRMNGGEWLPIPQIEGTPTDPLRYMRNLMGSAVVPLPLTEVRLGANVFEFACGPQVFHGLTWGIFKIYAFTVRIYYNGSKPRPHGEIVSPRAQQLVGEQPSFEVTARGAAGDDSKLEFTSSDAMRVDYVGLYTDFDWEGNGVFRQWHYQLEQGQLAHHIGTAVAPPFRVTWDTRWLPDQDQPMRIAAFVTDTHGITFMTEAIEVRFQREKGSVRMYPAHAIPEYFAVRIGNRKECRIQVGDDPRRASAGRLFLSTWAGGHADAIELNGHRIAERVGRNDYYSYDSIDVDPAIVQPGENVFSVFSNTVHHSVEINWPGPVLMLSFPG